MPMPMDDTKRKKVLCPVTKDNKTYWMKMGVAFVNKDNSINVYLDCLPTNGKLHVRDWDDDRKPYSPPRKNDGEGGDFTPAASTDELPF